MDQAKRRENREHALALLAGRIASGRAFFEVAAQALAAGSGCRWAGIGLRDATANAIDVLAFWDGQRRGEPFRFALDVAPCAQVYQAPREDPHCFVGSAVDEKFADFSMLREMKARSFRGEAFFDADGRAVGHVFVLDEADHGDHHDVRSFFRLVAQRVGAEYNRWRAEQALAASEARYAALFRQSNDGVLLLDTHGRILDVNQVTCRRLNRSHDRLVGGDVMTLIGGPAGPKARQGFERLVTGQAAGESDEITVQRADGTTYPVEISSSLIATDDEQLVQVIVRDLTERKQAERALKVYQQMVASVGDQMVFVDRSYELQAVNAAFLGSPHVRGHMGERVEADAVVGQPIDQVIGAGPFAHHARHLERALAGEDVSFEIATDDAPPAYLHVRYHPYRVGETVVGVVGTLRDIGRRKRGQAALFRVATDPSVASGDIPIVCGLVTETMAEVLGIDAVGVWMLQDDGRSMRCLDRFQADAGRHDRGALMRLDGCPRYAKAVSAGRALDANDVGADPRTAELVAGAGERSTLGALLEAPIRAEGAVVGVVRCEAHGGPHNWRAGDLSLAGELADQIALALVNRDRKRLEEQLFRTRKLESLGMLAGGIAHDFNNLLLRILGGVELSLRESGAEAAVGAHLYDVREAALGASDLCTQMLAYAGQRRLALEPVDLVFIIENVVATAQAKGADVRLAHAAGLPAVEGDERQLSQLVTSLLTNARESLADVPGSQITVRAGVIPGTDSRFENALPEHRPPEPRAPQYVHLQVRDTGSGMAPETLTNLFDPFFTTKFIGRGLGMAAVLGAVKAHRGSIVVESAVGTGTTVDVMLPAVPPLASSTAATTGVSTDRRAFASPPGRAEVVADRGASARGLNAAAKARVLVVDDEPDVRDIAQKLLEAVGYQAYGVGDGAEAVQVFRNVPQAYDVVLLDLTMPGMSGDEVGRALRQMRPDLPIILSSGYNEQDANDQLGDFRCDGYLRKPYELQRLVEALDQALASA